MGNAGHTGRNRNGLDSGFIECTGAKIGQRRRQSDGAQRSGAAKGAGADLRNVIRNRNICQTAVGLKRTPADILNAVFHNSGGDLRAVTAPWLAFSGIFTHCAVSADGNGIGAALIGRGQNILNGFFFVDLAAVAANDIADGAFSVRPRVRAVGIMGHAASVARSGVGIPCMGVVCYHSNHTGGRLAAVCRGYGDGCRAGCYTCHDAVGVYRCNSGIVGCPSDSLNVCIFGCDGGIQLVLVSHAQFQRGLAQRDTLNRILRQIDGDRTACRFAALHGGCRDGRRTFAPGGDFAGAVHRCHQGVAAAPCYAAVGSGRSDRGGQLLGGVKGTQRNVGFIQTDAGNGSLAALITYTVPVGVGMQGFVEGRTRRRRRLPHLGFLIIARDGKGNYLRTGLERRIGQRSIIALDRNTGQRLAAVKYPIVYSCDRCGDRNAGQRFAGTKHPLSDCFDPFRKVYFFQSIAITECQIADAGQRGRERNAFQISAFIKCV